VNRLLNLADEHLETPRHDQRRGTLQTADYRTARARHNRIAQNLEET
jgi:hypothetical protein